MLQGNTRMDLQNGQMGLQKINSALKNSNPPGNRTIQFEKPYSGLRLKTKFYEKENFLSNVQLVGFPHKGEFFQLDGKMYEVLAVIRNLIKADNDFIKEVYTVDVKVKAVEDIEKPEQVMVRKKYFSKRVVPTDIT